MGEVTTDEVGVYMRIRTLVQTVEGENSVAGVMGTTLVLGDDIFAAVFSNIAPGFTYEPLETEIEVFMNDLVTINGTPADLSGSSGSGLSRGFERDTA